MLPALCFSVPCLKKKQTDFSVYLDINMLKVLIELPCFNSLNFHLKRVDHLFPGIAINQTKPGSSVI